MKHTHEIFRAMLIALLLITYIPFSEAEGSDSWEVEIIKKETGEVVKSEVVSTNLFPLNGLEYDVEYFAKIRTKNTFLSDWEISDDFLIDRMSNIVPVCATNLILSSNDGVLFISSEKEQEINIYTVDGRLQRLVSLPTGETSVTGLEKGLYLIDGRKIIVK
ncbi:hypothetical protein [Dysgonomonas sp. 520]|uniref:hypothetical protein n=1 Tax=Dysgonomonas sp. 520 TaxID=2302931 RepID=UPI0013D56C4F|nr:hypothetical protein [Dysgonomonas sp. 520]